MYKNIAKTVIVCGCLFAILLSGCAKKQTPATTQATETAASSTETTETTTEKVMKVDFSDEEIEKMSNFMNEGRLIKTEDYIYGKSFKSNGNGTLTMVKKDGTG